MDYQKELGSILEEIKVEGVSSEKRELAAEILWSWDQEAGIPGIVREQVIELFIRICLPSGIFPKEATSMTSVGDIMQEIVRGKAAFLTHINRVAEKEKKREKEPKCVKAFAALMRKGNEKAEKGETLNLIQQETAYVLYDLLNESAVDKSAKSTAVSDFIYLFHRWMWENPRVGVVHRRWVYTAMMESASETKKAFMSFTFSDAIYNY